MKKRTKSQVSVFIIIAIIIVVAIGILILVRINISKPGGERINPEIAPIYSFVQDCAKQTAEDAVYYIGQTGGYFVTPELVAENNVAYYFYNDRNYIPDKEKVQEELSLYMNNIMFFCVREFEDFPDFDVKAGDITSSARIEDERVVFSIDYPVSVSKGDKTYSIEKLGDIEIPARLGIVYNTASEIMIEQMANKQDICISCLNSLAIKNDLYIDMADYQNDSVLFVITDPNSKVNDKEYQFYFINKYD